MASHEINLITPTSCRICLVIRARHARYISNAEHGKELTQLVQIRYSLIINYNYNQAPDYEFEKRSLQLQLSLDYGRRPTERILLVLNPAQCEHLLPCLALVQLISTA